MAGRNVRRSSAANCPTYETFTRTGDEHHSPSAARHLMTRPAREPVSESARTPTALLEIDLPLTHRLIRPGIIAREIEDQSVEQYRRCLFEQRFKHVRALVCCSTGLRG